MGITRTGEKVTVGRKDYRWGVEAEIVTVGGETFAEFGGRFYTACGFCVPAWSGSKSGFEHVLNAVCFQCNGTGVHKRYDSAEKVEQIVKRRIADRARRDRKAAEKEAAQAEALAVWQAANPTVVAAAAEVMADRAAAEQYTDADYKAQTEWEDRWGDFVTDLANQAQYRPLTDAQTEAFLPAVEKAKAEHAEAVEVAAKRRYLDVAEGARPTVTGVITVAATFEASDYHGRPMSKRVVIVEGNGDFEGVTVKMMGTAQALWDAEKGEHVEVTGTVKGFDEYEGVPQTSMIRPKIKEVETA